METLPQNVPAVNGIASLDIEARTADRARALRCLEHPAGTRWPLPAEDGLWHEDTEVRRAMIEVIAQKWALIADQILDTPDWSDEQIARALGYGIETEDEVRGVRIALQQNDSLVPISRTETFRRIQRRRRSRVRRERELAAGPKITEEEWLRLCDQHNFRCACCGELRRLTPEHIVPLSKGGSNDRSNCQPLCAECNARKGLDCTDYRLEEVTAAFKGLGRG